VHWCHQWNTDFLYARSEINQIAAWLADCGLRLLDLHSPVGPEKDWAASQEYQRLAGVDLVKNRIAMTARLAGQVVIMHVPDPSGLPPLRRSLDELAPYARRHGVRIALENGSFATISQVLSEYGPDYLGLCYDAGHGNVDGDGLDRLDALKHRLISVHLHDNDGRSDQHKLLFSGTVDWARLAGIIARSAYTKCVSMEIVMRDPGTPDEPAFLAQARQTGTRFAAMIASAVQ